MTRSGPSWLVYSMLAGVGLIGAAMILGLLFGPKIFADVLIFTLGKTFGVLLRLFGLS